MKEATFYSILCDEVSNLFNKEQVSIRFVVSKDCIREVESSFTIK